MKIRTTISPSGIPVTLEYSDELTEDEIEKLVNEVHTYAAHFTSEYEFVRPTNWTPTLHQISVFRHIR